MQVDVLCIGVPPSLKLTPSMMERSVAHHRAQPTAPFSRPVHRRHRPPRARAHRRPAARDRDRDLCPVVLRRSLRGLHPLRRPALPVLQLPIHAQPTRR